MPVKQCLGSKEKPRNDPLYIYVLLYNIVKQCVTILYHCILYNSVYPSKTFEFLSQCLMSHIFKKSPKKSLAYPKNWPHHVVKQGLGVVW